MCRRLSHNLSITPAFFFILLTIAGSECTDFRQRWPTEKLLIVCVGLHTFRNTPHHHPLNTERPFNLSVLKWRAGIWSTVMRYRFTLTEGVCCVLGRAGWQNSAAVSHASPSHHSSSTECIHNHCQPLHSFFQASTRGKWMREMGKIRRSTKGR